MASLWEMAIKVKIGKLDLLVDFKEFVFHLKKNNIEILPLAFEIFWKRWILKTIIETRLIGSF